MDIQKHIKLVQEFKKNHPEKEILDGRKTNYSADYVEFLYSKIQ